MEDVKYVPIEELLKRGDYQRSPYYLDMFLVIGIGVLILVLVGLYVALKKYRRALSKWKSAGGQIPDPQAKALDEAALPQHHWVRKKRHQPGPLHAQHPALPHVHGHGQPVERGKA